MGDRLGIASDHAGKELKQLIYEMLKMTEHEVTDYGVASDATASVDYPDYAFAMAQDIAQGKLDRGIAICGTGIGMAIAANKVQGIRAAVVWDDYTSRMCRAHNDVNVLCLGSRTLNYMRASDFVKIWLATSFEGGRHQMRLTKIREIEKKLR